MFRTLKRLWLNFRIEDLDRIFIPCPACKSAMPFAQKKLLVNIESEQLINVPGFLQPNSILIEDNVCPNPYCKWSRVKTVR